MKIELIEIIDEHFPMKIEMSNIFFAGITYHKDQFQDYPYTARVSVDNVEKTLGCFMPNIESEDEGLENLIREVERQIGLGENKLFLPNAYIPRFWFNEVFRQINQAYQTEFYFNFENSVLKSCELNKVRLGDKTSFRKTSLGDKTSFDHAKFGEKTDLRYASFGKNTRFDYAKFGEITSFWKASFGDNSSFLNASFGDMTRFEFASFGENTSFWKASFGENTSFFNASFGENTYFGDASFGDDSSFANASFGKNTIFWDASFGENTSFFNASFGENTYFGDASFNGGADFRDSVAKGISFENATVNKVLYLGRNHNDRTDNQMSWMNLKGLRVYGFLEPDLSMDFKKELAPCVKAITNKDGTKDLNAIKETFHVLKQAYSKLGRYEEEDLAYYEFKRAENKEKRVKYKSRNFFVNIWGYVCCGLRTFTLDWCGGYGTKPIMVILFMLGVYLLFASIFFVAPQLNNKDIICGAEDKYIILNLKNEPIKQPILYEAECIKDLPINKRLGKAMYHSGVTFLTIGYGDLRPCTGLGIFFSILEGFCGLFLMSYLTIAFSRKVLR